MEDKQEKVFAISESELKDLIFGFHTADEVETLDFSLNENGIDYRYWKKEIKKMIVETIRTVFKSKTPIQPADEGKIREILQECCTEYYWTYDRLNNNAPMRLNNPEIARDYWEKEGKAITKIINKTVSELSSRAKPEQLTKDRAYEIYDKFVDDITEAKTPAEVDKVRDNFIRDIFGGRVVKPEQDNGDVNTPQIVCLCGSTRFKKEYEKANYLETLKGNIVLSVGCYMHHDSNGKFVHVGGFDYPLITEEQKINLDKLHFKKIELANDILVLNVGGYIGNSTRNEINHAKKLGKKIRYLKSQ